MNAASFNLVMLLLWAGTARAEDWQMFRGGPALLGVADGSLPTKPELLWSFKTGRLLWKYETGEKILGGPNFVSLKIQASNLNDGGRMYILVGSYDFKLHCVE